MYIGVWGWLASIVLVTGGLYFIAGHKTLWAVRKGVGRVAIGLMILSLPLLIFLPVPPLQLILLGLLQSWLLLCAARLVVGRLDESFLRRSTRQSIGLVLLFGMMAVASTVIDFFGLPVLLGLSLVLAWTFAAQAIWTLKHYRLRSIAPLPPLQDLPTVTIAIPARNETAVLAECIRAAIASDYPKLEIIVLDDCSQDKTSEQIWAFAHDGVRFIQGEQPSDGWLGKNNAMRALAEHASGDYIVFADVDTRLERQSVSQLMTYMLSRKLDMVSVLAQRREGLHWGTVLWQLKYYWQIVLPITERRVPVASQCWIINSDWLRQLGSFEAVRQKIVPEAYFARQLQVHDAYRFIVSNAALGVTTAKKWSSQNDTAVRLLYPTCKRQPLIVFAACIGLALMLLPLTYVIYIIISGQTSYMWLALSASALYSLSYLLVVTRTNPHAWAVTWLGFVPSLLQEIVLVVVSMLKYEFGTVDWKGRNVCYPVIVPERFARPAYQHGNEEVRPEAPHHYGRHHRHHRRRRKH